MSQTFHNGLPGNDGGMDGFRGAKRPFLWVGIFFIAIVTLLAYSSVFSAGFIWDDDDHVIKIMSLANIDGLARIWFDPGTTIQYYPLVFTAFWAQIQLWGLEPFGFHLVNIVLHIGNALLLWICLTRLDIPGAFWAACIFALHPLHVESVAWITELKNVLSAFFYLLALLSYWRFSELHAANPECRRNARLFYLAALILFSFALLSKTVSCTLPAVILLLFWWKRGRIELREIVPLLPFFILAVVLGLLTLRVETDYLLAKGPEWNFSIVERLLIAGRVIWFHAGKILWPYPLMFNYPRWQLDTGLWWQYLFPLTAFTLLILFWRNRERTGRGLLAACLFTMGTNFPVLGFLNVYSMRFSFVADHYYYLANIGVIVLFCAAICLVRQQLPTSFRHAEKIFYGVILLILALLTWQQGKIYQDRLTLFNDIITKNPASWFGYSNRAVCYAGSGRDDLAMADLEKSLELKPDEADALHARGIINLKQKKYDRAFADFDRSIAIRPWRADYYKNRSIAYRSAGRLDNALVDADRIIAMEPVDAQNFLLRASIYAMQEEYAKSLGDLNLAERIDPEDFQIYANRGLVYYRQGLQSQAIREYDMALRLSPESAETFYNRGLAHAAAGFVAKSRSDLVRARELGYQLDEVEIRRILSLPQLVKNSHDK